MIQNVKYRKQLHFVGNTCPIFESVELEAQAKEHLSDSAIWAAVDVQTYAETDLFRQKRPEKDLIVALDHIQDPRNLGAIVRSSAFFGIKNVLVPKDRQVLLTKSSVITAQGGFALTDLVVVTNLVRTLQSLKEQGYWVVGTKVSQAQDMQKATRFDKTVLVLGSEEKGISSLVEKVCDLNLSIPSPGKTLDSLNISVAAGIFIQHLAQFD